MSKRHFFKHVSYTISHRLTPYPSPLLQLPIFKTIHPFKATPISSPLLFLNTPLSSSPSSSFACSCNTSTATAQLPHYLSVRIRCPRNVADSFSEALLCFGASSISIDEKDGQDNFNEICIDSIFSEAQDVVACLLKAADSIGLREIPTYEIKKGEQYDWVQKTLESFHPVEITDGLWIVPEWRSPPDTRAMNIIVNPGLAFGTGEHPTTKLCLLLLRRLIKKQDVFLDYGTGSGILAIAALKFGAARSVGFDIDPQAIKSALHNAALNDVNPEMMQLHLVPANAKSDETTKEHPSRIGVFYEKEKYDMVIANILLNPLLELADHIVSYAKPGGVVGLSGILSEQLPYILDRYSTLLEDIAVSGLDDWVCVSGRKIKHNRDRP